MLQLSAQGKDQIQSILNQAVESGRAPGLVFGATSEEKELFFAHAGQRVYGDPSSGPIDENSVFWICSQTKMLASIAVFQLIEAGRLTLDTDVTDYLPELAYPVVSGGDLSRSDQWSFTPSNTKITVRHLLNHTSGLDYGSEKDRVFEHYLPTPYTSSHDKLDPVKHFYDLRKGIYPSQLLKFEPGTSFAYSYGPDSAGFIVERITGQTLEEYYKENIFLPLGITSASFYLTEDLKRKAVSLTYRETNGNITQWASQLPLIVQDPDHTHLHMSGVGLYCSMKDYLTILRHLLQIEAGTIGTTVKQILRAESVRTFFEPTLPPLGVKLLNDWLGDTDHNWSTALCLNTIDTFGGRKKGSGFWWGWAGTSYFIDPTTGVALVFGSQIVPKADPEVNTIWAEIEETFYLNLEKVMSLL